MCWQKSLEVAEKIKTILARLGRLGVVVKNMGDEVGLKQRSTLFE